MRPVPGQDPARILPAVIDHLERAGPPGVRLAVTESAGGVAAYLVPPQHPLLLAAEEALESSLGARPLRVRIGATLPLSDMVRQRLGLDTVMFSFSTADEDFHAPNEFFQLSAIGEGFAAWRALIRALGRQKPATYAPYRGVAR